MAVVVITGVSQGIGKSTAELFIEKGHKVYGISRSKVEHANLISIQADVTAPKSIEKAISQILEQEQTIDIWINNAGMGISGAIEDTRLEDAAYLFDVNFMGVFTAIKAVLPQMRKQKQGKILNIGSVAGVLTIPFQAFYSASKAAVMSFTDALHNEVSPFGIQVCTILPGDIKTEFTKNRKKNEIEHDVYKNRIQKSLAVMEKDELTGMSSQYAAKVIYKTTMRKHLPLSKTIGFKYKVFVFLKRFLPHKIVNQLIGSIYAFKKEK